MNLITPPNAAAQVPDATTNTHVSSSCLHDVSHVFPYPLADVMMLFLLSAPIVTRRLVGNLL
jgi:hypothetical protein